MGNRVNKIKGGADVFNSKDGRKKVKKDVGNLEYVNGKKGCSWMYRKRQRETL